MGEGGRKKAAAIAAVWETGAGQWPEADWESRTCALLKRRARGGMIPKTGNAEIDTSKENG